jgi:hypothetical protein
MEAGKEGLLSGRPRRDTPNPAGRFLIESELDAALYPIGTCISEVILQRIQGIYPCHDASQDLSTVFLPCGVTHG